MTNIFQIVKNADPKRKLSNLPRRLLKAMEELGELSQAYLSVTSKRNKKQKTWDDVKEEAVDCLVLAIDNCLTLMNEDDIVALLEKKCDKWKNE
jgi:NTP pyrophosphatase (non-canonical NTP hydrolase)